MPIDYSKRAKALVGTRFRPQGRSAASGLDCVGLVLAAFDISPKIARRNYRLRGDHRLEIEAGLSRRFRRITPSKRRTGDVLLLAVTADQFHLAIVTDAGFVHADAALRQVVETPGDPKWPILGAYRRRVRHRKVD
jgi:hypothetical protein